MSEYEIHDLIGALVRFKAQLMICFDRIEALILQRVGVDFIKKSDIAPLLTQIDHHAAMLFDIF